ncbi:MAG: hypothetical protein LKJ29_06700 [Lactobacillus sp.]|jgi:hypothetical protein|uniref:Transposase n=1 Tax=Lacticaseibacillus suilingensis TaxID=2799577 RepID=A0ABW4BH99_9LACO|nr:hypothetical protein [Lacticaseibacillus suilingensis]MCI1895148.1 hypothetical protein [Lactobacillus sp.]MCI1917027.1 hypothetical protein [Lactobacillus sp.]MCI1941724.1 hypothetical protein [Lactobacillus sp.]MCI1972339.1 hypothetical protein [Lactobacillus sp.]MCI2017697.1 hypothetical protein [Lactobacillus sp.]
MTKQYQLKSTRRDGNPTTTKIGHSLKNTNDRIAETVVNTHKKIERNVVGAYKRIEGAFIDRFLEEVPEDTEKRKTNDGKA